MRELKRDLHVQELFDETTTEQITKRNAKDSSVGNQSHH